MNPFKSIGPAFRRLGVILLITLLVCLCLSLYYFKYVPANRNRVEHLGFLMLKQHSNGINYTISDLRETFCQYRNKFYSENGDSSYKQLRYEKPFIYTVESVKANLKENKQTSDCRAVIHFDSDDRDQLSFLFSGKFDTLTYSVPLDSVFNRSLHSAAPDFFDSYLVLSQSDHPHILYSSPDLPVVQNLQDDTLAKTLKRIQFSKIVTIDIGGNSHKAFLQPMTVENRSLLLVGLLSENEYNKRLQNIPFNTVSMVIILFVLILIVLPYIKIFMISSAEHIGIKDIAFAGSSMLIGTAVLLAICHHLLMQTGALIRTKEELYNLGQTINNSIHDEVTKAYKELYYFDISLASKTGGKDSATRLQDKNDKLTINKNSQHQNRFDIPFPQSRYYLNYSILHWADDSGKQLYKARLDDNAVSFVNIYKRNYFKDVLDNRLFSSPDTGSGFAIEPVYSRTTNSFEVNVSIPSRVDSGAVAMAAISTHLSSLMNTILPAGYGFYVIDSKGLINFQSEGSVTLQENFLEWINDDQTLAQTLASRQSRYLPNQYINNKQYSLLIQPLANLPWHLAVYHCNEHTTASVLRVDAFTLFFLLILYSVLFMFSLIIWSQTSYFTRLTQPVYQYDWIRPGENKLEFLSAAKKYLIIYIAIALGAAFYTRSFSTSLYIGLVAPLFTLWILYVLFYYKYLDNTNKDKTNRPAAYTKTVMPVLKIIKNSVTKRFNTTPLLFIGLLSVIYYLLETDSSAIGLSIVFLLFSFALFFVALSDSHFKIFKYTGLKIESKLQPTAIKPGVPFVKPELKLTESNRVLREKSNGQYYKFWALSAFAISIVPAFCFFQYAQNKEIALQIKSRQLYLAQRTEERLPQFRWLEDILHNRTMKQQEIDKLLYKEGIYLVSEGDRIDTDIKPGETPCSDSRRTELYDTLMNYISWDYRSLDKWIPIQNRAADDQWKRNDYMAGCKDMTLLYNLRSGYKPADTISKVSSLRISSLVPGIFSYYHISLLGEILFSVFVISLLIFGYFMLRKLIGKFFQINYFDEAPVGGWKDANVVQKMTANPFINPDPQKALDNYEAIFHTKVKDVEELWCKEFEYKRTDPDQIELLENVILFNQSHFHYLYEQLWKKCDEKEKYFLYDMARDGFTNYKKSQMIQQMLYKGYLRRKQGNLSIMSVSFRNFITLKKGSGEITKLTETHQPQGTWSNIRTPVLVAIAAIGIFLFITQDGLFQRIGALIPTLSSILGLGSTLLGKSGGK